MKLDLAPYVPLHVRSSGGPGARQRAQTGEHRFTGAAMVVDIEGFSSLTEAFAAQGASGAERLAQVLDQYFGRMTDIAIGFGGDVIDFVGDALVVTWEAQGPLADTALLAVQCGLELQAGLAQLCAAGGTALGQRIAIGCGAMAHLELGGVEGKWHCLTVGQPLTAAAASFHDGASGEVIVTPEVWSLVGGRCQGRVLATGRACVQRVVAPMPLPAPASAAGASGVELERYVPHPLLERMRAGGGRWLAEFRNITVLFVGLPGLDEASPHLLATLQQAVECVQRAHGRYGGTLTRLSMDDKGVTLLCAFGLPLTASEDNALRAVLAGVAITGELPGIGIACAAGLTSGVVFYGDSGGVQRRHVGMVGMAVNTAARLMVAAQGGLLCDDATREGAAHGFAFGEQQSLRLKGRQEPVTVWRPLARRASERGAFSGAIVGRETESARIAESVAALAQGRGGRFVLVGEAGIGKSRLVAHACAHAAASGVKVVTAAGIAIESATPYYALRQVVSEAFFGGHESHGARDPAALEQAVDGDSRLRERLPLLNDILPTGIADTPITGEIVGAARASSLHALLRGLFLNLARVRPMLVVADDAHWFDAASARALSALAQDLPGVLVLAVSRPLDASAVADVAQLVDDSSAARLLLEALPRAAVESLICAKLGAQEVSAELADFLFARTSGNPLYVEELVLALRNAKLVEVRGPKAVLTSAIDSPQLGALPDSLRGVIVSRMDALGAREQLALKIASVIGREFSLLMLRDLHPDTGTDFGGLIDTLLREDIVRYAARGARGEYTFKHVIVQDVVYDQLSFALRGELHGEAARWIERTEAGDLDPFCSELALHWERTGNGARAVDYLERAAQQALARYANGDALRHIGKAMQLAQSQPLAIAASRSALWQALLGDAHHALFEYDAAAGHFSSGLALAGRRVPAGIPALLLALTGELVSQLAVRAGLRGRAAPGSPRTAALQWASHVYERLAEIAYFDNRPLRLLHATLASLNLAERSGATRETVDGYAALSIGFQHAQALAASRYYNRRSLAVAEEAGNLAEVGYAHLVNCVYQATRGDWQALQASHATAESIYRQLGAGVRWHQARSVLYTSYVTRGLFDEGARELLAVRSEVNRDTPSTVRSWIAAAEMVLELARGCAPGHLLSELDEVQGGGLHRADLLQCKGLAAHARMVAGRMDEALRGADEALELLAAGMPTAWHITPGLAGIAEVYLAAWESDAGSATLRERSRRVCRVLERYGRTTPISAPRAAILAGRNAALGGRTARARDLWLRAAQLAESLEMPWDRERAEGLARSVAAQSTTRRAQAR